MSSQFKIAKASWQELTERNKSWLLNANSYTRHKTLLDLLEIPDKDDIVLESGKLLLEDKNIKKLILDASEWFPTLPKRHDNSTMSHYKLRMLSDYRLKTKSPEIESITAKLKSYKKSESGYLLLRDDAHMPVQMQY